MGSFFGVPRVCCQRYDHSMITTVDMRTTIEIVDFPSKNGDFPVRCVSLPEGNQHNQHNWLVVWNMTLIFPNSWDDDPI